MTTTTLNDIIATMDKPKAPRAERVAAHRAAMKRLGEILAARKAARRPEAK